MLHNALKCTDITIVHDKSQIGLIHDINDCKSNNKKKTSTQSGGNFKSSKH